MRPWSILFAAIALLPGCIDQGPDRVADDVRFLKESPESPLCREPIPPGERVCDYPGSSFRCAYLGYSSNDFRAMCRDNCTWDVSACLEAQCGATSVGGDVECDPSLPDPSPCLELSNEPHAGVLCTDQCRLVEVACPWCGDGTVNSTETCEPSLGPVPCVQIDGYFGDGEVVCGRRCRFDYGDLTRTCERIECGDGVVSEGEICDVGPDVFLSVTDCPYGRERCRLCVDNCTRTSTVMGRYCRDGRVQAGFEPECDDYAPRDEWCEGRGAPEGSSCVDCALADGECEPSWDNDAGGLPDAAPETDAEEEVAVEEAGEPVGAEPLDDANSGGDPVADEPAGCGAGHGAAAPQLMYALGVLFGMGYRRRRIRAAHRPQ